MATRFYLPISGTEPLSSLAVDSGWTRSDSLLRKPCDITKTDSQLMQKSAIWQVTSTSSWVWMQFQSKCLATGYSWITGDTVSMVIKVAEAAAQVDSHLAYCIRVVSQDGSTIRGTIGVFRTSSSEYPTSLATIATRIHSARTDGASNFSSQAGDRIIIEIGHYGITPTLNAVYFNYGAPTGTGDYALTAGLTTDLCPWVELSRDVSFDNRSSAHGYMEGTVPSAESSLPAYAKGGISASQDAFTVGGLISDTPAYLVGGLGSSQDAFTVGGLASTQDAYLVGGVISSQTAFAAGGLGSQVDAYLVGGLVSSQSAFLSGGLISDVDAFLVGGIEDLSETPAYLEGLAGGTDTSDAHVAYLEGIGPIASGSSSVYLGGKSAYALRPDGDITVGGFQNELGGSTLYASLDEPMPADDDYIWHEAPVVGSFCEVSLSNPGGDVPDNNHILRWRAKRLSGTLTTTMECELRQGATTIASDEQVLTDDYQTFEKALSAGEIASITDYTDLRVRFTVTALT